MRARGKDGRVRQSNATGLMSTALKACPSRKISERTGIIRDIGSGGG